MTTERKSADPRRAAARAKNPTEPDRAPVPVFSFSEENLTDVMNRFETRADVQELPPVTPPYATLRSISFTRTVPCGVRFAGPLGVGDVIRHRFGLPDGRPAVATRLRVVALPHGRAMSLRVTDERFPDTPILLPVGTLAPLDVAGRFTTVEPVISGFAEGPIVELIADVEVGD